MKKLWFFTIIFATAILTVNASWKGQPQTFESVKDFQMSDDRGRLYVILTNKTHIPFLPLGLFLHSNCQKKKENWKQAEYLKLVHFCDVDFEMTKINKAGTVLSVYARMTDVEDLNRSTRKEESDPKCHSPRWYHIDLKDYCTD